MRGEQPGRSIRSRLLLLVLAATLPLFVFSAGLLLRAYSSSSALVKEVAIVNVRRLALSVDAPLHQASHASLRILQCQVPRKAQFPASR